MDVESDEPISAGLPRSFTNHALFPAIINAAGWGEAWVECVAMTIKKAPVQTLLTAGAIGVSLGWFVGVRGSARGQG